MLSDLILRTYLHELDVKTPDELALLLKSLDQPEVSEALQEIQDVENVFEETKDNHSKN